MRVAIILLVQAPIVLMGCGGSQKNTTAACEGQTIAKPESVTAECVKQVNHDLDKIACHAYEQDLGDVAAGQKACRRIGRDPEFVDCVRYYRGYEGDLVTPGRAEDACKNGWKIGDPVPGSTPEPTPTSEPTPDRSARTMDDMDRCLKKSTLKAQAKCIEKLNQLLDETN